jgi:hypothetical protein
MNFENKFIGSEKCRLKNITKDIESCNLTLLNSKHEKIGFYYLSSQSTKKNLLVSKLFLKNV